MRFYVACSRGHDAFRRLRLRRVRRCGVELELLLARHDSDRALSAVDVADVSLQSGTSSVAPP
jgi:hypothetical protein